MANLIYNGIEITIENKQVSLTNLYTAIGKPPNKAPTNFKTSKEGKQKINKYSNFQVYGVRLQGFVNHFGKCLGLRCTLFAWNLLYVTQYGT
ncbi:hypothetical protein [Microcoleus sp. Pol14D5]|uniref:hypothetical protein n=1 Tax=Microcoleus sp. Pol14D5 TaxID=3055401 RepID=UPI002FD50936